MRSRIDRPYDSVWIPENPDAKRVVIRAGGALEERPGAWDTLRLYVKQLRTRGREVLLVHTEVNERAAAIIGRETGAEAIVLAEAVCARDPDWTCESLANQVGADALEFATDVHGVYTEAGIAGTLGMRKIRELIRQGTVRGGMVPKLHSAVTGVLDGVREVRIGTPSSLREEWATRILARRHRSGARREPHAGIPLGTRSTPLAVREAEMPLRQNAA